MKNQSAEKMAAASKEKLKKWCTVTSCHGVMDLVESPSVLGKIFWAVLILTVLGIATWQVYELCVQFFSPPHYETTTYSVDHGDALFPNITLCNFNRAQRDRAMELGMTMPNDSSKLDPDYLNYFYTSFPVQYPLGIFYDIMASGQEGTLAKVQHWKEKYETWKAQQNLSHVGPAGLLYKMGLTCKDMVIRCEWSGYHTYECCNSEAPIITIYGLCWSLRPLQEYVDRTGSKSALSVTLLPRINTYTHEVVESNYLEEGLILGVNFNPYDYTIASPIVLRPGTSNIISMKNHLYVHEEPQFITFKKECQDNSKLRILKGRYSKEYCLRDCFFYQLNSSCGCVPLSETQQENTVFCEGAEPMICSSSTVQAVVTESKKSIYSQCIEGCRVPCEPQPSVETTVVTAKFPAPNFREGLTKRFSDLKLDQYVNVTMEWILVDIYFSTTNQLVTAMHEKVPIFNLIGSVGGQLGLWLGMSILTIVQAVYYMLPHAVSKNET